MHRFFWPVLLLLTFAGAQPPPVPKAPVISDAVKLRFFKASAEAQTASQQAQLAQQTAQAKTQAFQAVVKELDAACGKDFQPQMNKAGDPECVAKPEAPKAKP